MRAPHHFFWDNLVLRTPTDAWAVYRLRGHSYPGLSKARKIEVAELLEGLVYAIEADFQILRVARRFDVASYLKQALTTVHPRHGHRDAFEAHLGEHRAALEERGAFQSDTYLAVRLDQAAGGIAALLGGTAELWRRAAERLGYAEGAGLSRKRLTSLRREEERVFHCVLGYLDCERIGSTHLAGLIRRAYTRGLGEPDLDDAFAPQAISFLDPRGEERFRPYGYDCLRLHDSRVEIGRRALTIDSELGRSFQTLLVVGALPEEAAVPSPAAELMFTPLEVDFPVDATLTAEFIANPDAQRLATKRKVDADQIAREEAAGAHGPSVQGAERPHQARELEHLLAGGDRPPLLRSALALAVAAPSAERLEERVQALRESFGRTQLHRPAGEQHRLLLASLPATPFPLPEYKEHLLPDQVGAMVPHAVSEVGSAIGPYIGYTLDGSRNAVRFDLAEAPLEDRTPTCLLAGPPGAGKTICLELLGWQAFLQGSLLVDIDPQGDHRLHELPGLAERSERIELDAAEEHQGMLDPLRIGSEDVREDLAYSFLISILPPPVKPEWQTQLRLALSESAKAGARSCADVLSRMAHCGDEDAAEAARAIEIHGSSGLARLGLGTPGSSLPEPGSAQLVALSIRNLKLPAEDTPHEKLTEQQRTSLAVLRLLAAYAVRLCAADRGRHAVLSMDEAWVLTGDSEGRAMLEEVGRQGRRRNITPLLSTQLIGDVEPLRGLIRAMFCFGAEDEREARAGLDLLRIGAEDDAAARRLLAFQAGRCYLRDFQDRVAPVQIDPPEWLLSELGTTPPTVRSLEPSPRRQTPEASGASGV